MMLETSMPANEWLVVLIVRLSHRVKGYADSYTPPEWEPLPLPAWIPLTELPNSVNSELMIAELQIYN